MILLGRARALADAVLGGAHPPRRRPPTRCAAGSWRTGRERARRAGLRGVRFSRELVLLGLLVALVRDARPASPIFFTLQHLLNTSRFFVEVGLIALGMTLIIITGGIDLSVGSTLAPRFRRPSGSAVRRRAAAAPRASSPAWPSAWRPACSTALIDHPARPAPAGGHPRHLRALPGARLRGVEGRRRLELPGLVRLLRAVLPRARAGAALRLPRGDRRGVDVLVAHAASAATSTPSATTRRRPASPACPSGGSRSRSTRAPGCWWRWRR